jgi:hypothetical protein
LGPALSVAKKDKADGTTLLFFSFGYNLAKRLIKMEGMRPKNVPFLLI